MAQSQGHRRGAARHAPALVSGVFEAHRQFEGDGPRDAHSPNAGGLRPALHGGTHVDAAALGPARELGRCGRERRRCGGGATSPAFRPGAEPSTIGRSTPTPNPRWKLRSVAGSRRTLATTPGWSISRPSAARSSKSICGQAISGRISTAADGSTRSSTSILAANGHSPIATVATATASCCSIGTTCVGGILRRGRSRTSGRFPACRASRSRSTRIAIRRCTRCLRAASGSRSSTAGTSTSALPRAIGSACIS